VVAVLVVTLVKGQSLHKNWQIQIINKVEIVIS